MNSADRNPILDRHMAAILRRSRQSRHTIAPATSLATRTVVYGSVAMLALSPMPALAVGLGDMRLASGLGQPLKATVPLRLAEGEALGRNCIRPSGADRELNVPRGITIKAPPVTGPGEFEIQVSSSLPLHEPMYELTLQIDCAGLPIYVREYVLMLDLPGSLAAQNPAAPVSRTDDPAPSARSVPPPATTRPALASSRDPIAAGSVYRVREGDTLSTIAARVANRGSQSIWSFAERIFAGNPQAFIRGSADLIKLGAELEIPAVTGDTGSAAKGTEAGVSPQTVSGSQPVPPAQSPVKPPAIENRQPKAVTSAPPAEAESRPELQRPATGESSSPFADERAETPASSTGDTQRPDSMEVGETSSSVDAAARTQAVPPPIVINEDRPEQPLNPLIATLLGMLLGFGLSIPLLRGRLIPSLLALTRRRSAKVASPEEQTFSDTDDWIRVSGSENEADPVPVNAPAEQTYVVEIGSDSTDLDAFETGSGTGHAEADANPDEIMLAEIFDDGNGDSAAPPDLPEEVFMGGTEQAGDEMQSAPTKDMPRPPAESTIEGSGELPEGETDDTIEGLDRESDETADLETGPAEISADDSQFSSTLRDALSLLEREYQNELTASQIIDRDALNGAIADADDGGEPRPSPQKKTG